MSFNPKALQISELLSQILSDAVEFDQEKHFGLIDILIGALGDLVKSYTLEFHSDNEVKVLIKIIIDFLLRIKDKHPFSDLVEAKIMDVLDIIMEFLFEYSFKPSKELCKEYTESEVTKLLNTLPSRKHLNCKFSKRYQMSEEDYELLRKRFKSRPPFVFYFNPDIQLQEKVYDGSLLKIGFFEKGTDIQIGAGMWVRYDGCIYQGFFKNNRHHIYGRLINSYEDIYEGGWDMGSYHGKGEIEYNSDGKVEVGQWVDRYRQGEFEIYDKSGKLTHRKVYQDGKEIKSEEVTDEEIYRQK